MSQYRKKPVVVDAEQFSYDRPQVCGVFYPSRSEDGKTYEGDAFVITMHNQRVYLQNGDWIIAEPDGEHFYPCKDDVFQATYEPVKSSSKSAFDLEPGEGWQPYMTLNADLNLEPETLDALAEMGTAVVEQDTEEIDWFNAPIEQVDAELRKFGLDPEQVGKTGARLAEAWLEAQRQKMRAEAAEAKVARIDDYMRYVAQSLDANCVVRPFEEWFSRR